ncbi:transcriptional regulator [Butyricicoccus faecihominis]|uniref:transcriptional regulator n=1 Tax=Butyricicoccaceae TaxID=3085642 RepID=UPI002479DC29|nr:MULTISPECIES: transcriptional regulator [Butyricicoccaceae]MCQ5128283.1 transcriptional regulator [Butyricicoccus faecihominis]WNX86526.1 transcriptional regulator [Agathobaculum sp. NTUH-O15-33]
MELIDVKEVQKVLGGIGKSKAYEIMQQLNQELEQKGYLVIRGKVPRGYLEERFHK